MIKINPLDVHDRLNHFYNHSMSSDISECCQDMVKQEPFGKRPFYIYAHNRTLDRDERIAILQDDLQKGLNDPTYIRKYPGLNSVPDQRMIWQPRLFKPKAQTNSMLFRAYPPSDRINIIWIIPKRELWAQYEKGKITENENIYSYIQTFQFNRELLEEPMEGEPTDEEAKEIYRNVVSNAKREKLMRNLYGT